MVHKIFICNERCVLHVYMCIRYECICPEHSSTAYHDIHMHSYWYMLVCVYVYQIYLYKYYLYCFLVVFLVVYHVVSCAVGGLVGRGDWREIGAIDGMIACVNVCLINNYDNLYNHSAVRS